MLRILIADDHPLYRQGLSRLVTELEPETELIEAGRAEETTHSSTERQGWLSEEKTCLLPPGSRQFRVTPPRRITMRRIELYLKSPGAFPLTLHTSHIFPLFPELQSRQAKDRIDTPACSRG